ncbi:MAG: M23 family metallopeptidase [Archangiaceae bacterium]|nr:M23 family metallopeptidase [Archangiaceae bacterium]
MPWARCRRPEERRVTAALLAFCLAAAADAGAQADAGSADAGDSVVVMRGAVRVRVQPGAPKPGDPVLITVYGAKEVPVGELGSWHLNFLPFRGGHQALIGLPTDLKLVPLKLEVQLKTDAKEEDYALTLDIVDPQFRKDELRVAGKYTSPSRAQKKWMAEDQREFNAAFGQPLEARLFEKAFEWPKLGRTAAPYGDRRMFNGKLQSQHYGVDIDGQIGDPAFAANDGTVVMVRECFGSGNTVLIHHGAGLYTAYFHLSRFDVKVGDKVKQGQRVGLVGKTGRVTGPHLHWGVKIDGRWVDGTTLLKLDFE